MADFVLAQGDCRTKLASYPESWAHSVVTDPPYELGFMNRGWDASGVAFDPATWRAVARALKPGAFGVAFGGTRTFHRLMCAIEDGGLEIRDTLCWLYGSGFPKSLNGPWGGTALKPGWEPIVLFRRPCAGTVAATFATYGTGGLGIEATRIEGAPSGRIEALVRPPVARESLNAYGSGLGLGTQAEPAGRWPANVALDEEAAAALDAQTGMLRSGTYEITPEHAGLGYGGGNGSARTGLASEGGASRFFYVAKASTSEREAGCEHFPKRTAGELVDRDDGAAGLSSPRAGAGRSSGGRANHHPTVKPIALMQWLVRLVTPPGGFVLDPFCGSGSTGCAAIREARHFIGIDLDRDDQGRPAGYLDIARARIGSAK